MGGNLVAVRAPGCTLSGAEEGSGKCIEEGKDSSEARSKAGYDCNVRGIRVRC